METEIRTYSAPFKRTWIVVLVFSLVVLAIGVYLGFIKSKGFERSTGVIVSLREEVSCDPDSGTVTYYYPTVKYMVDGKEYMGELDTNDSPNSVGKEVMIQYDPENPAKVNSYSPGIVIYILIVGGVLFAVAAYQLVIRKDKLIG